MRCRQCDGADPHDLPKAIFRHVNRYGWHVTQVLAGCRTAGFAYSVGLVHSFDHPEIIVFGLKEDDLCPVINDLGREVQAGRILRDGEERRDLFDPYKCVFKMVDRSWYDEYLIHANWFYGGRRYPALQVIWPDAQNLYPWEPGFAPRWRGVQPLMFRPRIRPGRRSPRGPAGREPQ